MTACICGAPEPCTDRCDRHGVEPHGYPCDECQDEWRRANPEKVAAIERLARPTRGGASCAK